MAAKDLCAIHGLDFGITENFDEFEFVYRNRMGKVKSTGIWCIENCYIRTTD